MQRIRIKVNNDIPAIPVYSGVSCSGMCGYISCKDEYLLNN